MPALEFSVWWIQDNIVEIIQEKSYNGVYVFFLLYLRAYIKTTCIYL
jgi:hypothetical protein